MHYAVSKAINITKQAGHRY